MFAEETRREISNQRKPINRLCVAIQRINSSLDPDTVLREILKSAGALASAQYGLIVTVNDNGTPENFTSSGVTAQAHRQFSEWPGMPGLIARFRNRSTPMRLRAESARALGFDPCVAATSLLGTPMRQRDKLVGAFFLAGKEGGGGFTLDDEEVLILFASQAAIALANATAHRAELRARSDLAVLVDTTPAGVMVIDAHTGRELLANREAKRIVRCLLDAEQSLDKLTETVRCRFSDGREIRLDQLPMSELLGRTRRLRGEEIQLWVPDGPSVSILINATPIRSADGEIESVVVAMQDLSPLKEIDRMRAEFLSTVSHELRAPLAAIKGSAATALGNARVVDPVEARQFFAIIEDQADQMDRLIGDLLDVGRIETGTLAVTPESTDLTVLVERARKTFLGGDAGHGITIDLPPNLPRIMADGRRIDQVLGNLLANSARHSPAGSPIHISAKHDGAFVTITVTDEGAGLTPEELARLFRKRVGGRAGRFRQSGLGLVICKGLVEAQGGRIHAESDGLGRGSRFTFTVPVADVEPADRIAQNTRYTPGQNRRTPILVVDDDPNTLRQLRNTLTGAGYAPIVTGEHTELAKIIRDKRPHLVLLDLMLRGTDGIELMRSVPALSELPVIFVSGYGRDETVAKALDSGAVDYIVKPFSSAELTARIRVALRRREDPASFQLGELAIDYENRRASVGGRDAGLTTTEYNVLCLLSQRQGRLVTNAQLLDNVWGETDDGDTSRLRSAIKKVRRKLGDNAAHPTWIFCERGVGYRLARAEEK